MTIWPEGVDAHFRALEGTHACSLDVTADTDTQIAPALALLVLLFAQLFVICRFQSA